MVTEFLERSLRRAVSNARSAADAITWHNNERRELTPHASPDGSGEAGELVRLSRAECLRLAGTKKIGRIAYVENARAISVVPVNYVLRPDGSVLFRSGPGPKLQSAERGDVVAFEIDNVDEATQQGWSVLITGRARKLSVTEQVNHGQLPEPWATGPRHRVVMVTPTRIEGRRLN